jgi:hypothetical protein
MSEREREKEREKGRERERKNPKSDLKCYQHTQVNSSTTFFSNE